MTEIRGNLDPTTEALLEVATHLPCDMQEFTRLDVPGFTRVLMLATTRYSSVLRFLHLLGVHQYRKYLQ